MFWLLDHVQLLLIPVHLQQRVQKVDHLPWIHKSLNASAKYVCIE